MGNFYVFSCCHFFVEGTKVICKISTSAFSSMIYRLSPKLKNVKLNMSQERTD